MRATAFFVWIETRLDEGGWVRRTYLVIATVMLWRIAEWAMTFTLLPGAARFSGSDISLITGAVSVPASIVAKFAFDAYLESRRKASGESSATSSTTTSTVDVVK